MSEEHPARRLTPLKLMISSAIGIGVGFGTCGIGAVSGNAEMLSRVLVPLGLTLFSLSVVAFLGSVVWMLVEAIGRWRAR